MLASAYLSLSLLFASALALGSSGHDRTPLDLAAKSRRLAKRNTKRQGTCAAKYTNSKSINGIAGLKRPTAFVARSGNTGLAVSGKAYRPVGPNVYWLGLDENDGGINYPSQSRVREAMAMAVAMGANTIRSTTLGVSVGNAKSVWPAANQPNEAAFQAIDYAIMAANRYGLRLVIPLTDEYQYYHGGKYVFLRWAGGSAANAGAAFYTHRPTINLYKAYIAQILNRKNSFTGVRYGDDPTIMAWETGNELGAYNLKNGAPPAAWTTEIATHIKSLAQRHLVIDGSDGTQYQNGKGTPGLGVKQVDIVSDHFYPLDTNMLAKDYAQAQRAKKALLVGEFDWTQQHGGTSLSTFVKAIEKQSGTGSMFWSLFGHDSQCCNFISHNDGYSLYYPNGQSSTLQKQTLIVAQHFYRMTGRSAPSSLVAVACPQPEIS